jgi:hypothetical protein
VKRARRGAVKGKRSPKDTWRLSTSEIFQAELFLVGSHRMAAVCIRFRNMKAEEHR